MTKILDDVSTLTHLGSKETEYKTTVNPGVLETFPNQFKDRDYSVTFTCPEWRSLCPKTGQPDFGTIQIIYTPNEKCIESKSLKLYLFSFSNTGMFMETICNVILQDISNACSPKNIKVIGTFNARGGIVTEVRAYYDKK